MCGSGRNLEEIAKFSQIIHIMDGSKSMIKEAKKIARDIGSIKLNATVSLAEEYKFKKHHKRLGLVVGWWNLCYLELKDIKRYLKGVKSTLVKDGCIVLAEPVLSKLTDEI